MKTDEKSAEATETTGCKLIALDVGNFKAFADTQHLPIKPLTLIFGANSSGKSSLIHSLLLANHALVTDNVDVHKPRLGGDSVDLGGFLEFVHQHNVEQGCTFGFTLNHRPSRTATWLGELSQTTLCIEIGKAIYTKSGKEYLEPVGVSSLMVTADGREFLRAARSRDGSLRVEFLNFEHPSFVPFFAQVDRTRPPDSEFRKTDSALTHDEIGKAIEMKEQSPYWRNPATRVGYEESLRHCQRDVEIRTDFFGQLRIDLVQRMAEIPLHPGKIVPLSTRSKGPREQYAEELDEEDIWRRIENYTNPSFFDEVGKIFCFEMENLLDWINAEFRRCLGLDSVIYLGPLRCYPPRHFVGMHDEDPNWFSGGGHAWDIVRGNPDLAKRLNSLLASPPWQSANYELRVRYLKDLGRVGIAEKKRLADRLQQLGANNEANALAAVDALLAELADDHSGAAFGEVTLLDRRTGLEVSHRDVGVGISQILPVLVHAYADQNQIVAIEQPEIHLHPALQAELGDVFIESALGERRNTFILETHSEHLILRILRRIRETTEGRVEPGATPITPEDVSVVFVEPTPNGSVVRHLPVTSDGDFAVPWPGGFFADRFKDLP